jgi:hypothetical protein
MSTLATPKRETHRRRRAALKPLFSKQKATNAGLHIQESLDMLCERLNREYRGTGQILPLDKMWGCLASDTIVAFCFDRIYNFIDAPGFDSPFVAALTHLLDSVHFVTQFAGIARMLLLLPDPVRIWLQPGMESVIEFNNVRWFPVSGKYGRVLTEC